MTAEDAVACRRKAPGPPAAIVRLDRGAGGAARRHRDRRHGGNHRRADEGEGAADRRQADHQAGTGAGGGQRRGRRHAAGKPGERVGIEIHELHAVRRVVFQNHVGQRFGEARPAVHEEGVTIQRLAGDEVADVQIRPAVVVEIAPRRGHAVAAQVDATGAGHVGKRAAVVAIERARAVVGHEQIEVTVEIEVGEARADPAVRRRAAACRRRRPQRRHPRSGRHPAGRGRWPALPGWR